MKFGGRGKEGAVILMAGESSAGSTSRCSVREKAISALDAQFLSDFVTLLTKKLGGAICPPPHFRRPCSCTQRYIRTCIFYINMRYFKQD